VSVIAPSTPAAVDVILRDGRALRLRPPGRADLEALVAFFAGLSPESRYLRFHGAISVDAHHLERFVEPDWDAGGALIATLRDVRDERVVALASWTRLRDPHSAEIAFAVADELQGHGLGTRLLEQLAASAAGAGIERFVAEVLPGNRAMLSVFADAGFDVHRVRADDAVEVTFPIEPTAAYVERIDERDHNAVVESLRPFFEPRTVAVIGASARRRTIGGELFRNILEGEFRGAAYPVNRRGEPVAGVKAYTTVAAIPDDVDLAVICVPGEHVLDAAAEALGAGVRGLCVISAGFAEMGAEGRARQEELLELVRAHGARMIGPNCLGIASSAVGVNATFAARPVPAGNIGFSSQSGALGLAMLEAAATRGLGLSAFVSIGNKADVSSNDLVEWWEDDDATELVVLYLESFGNPRKFARLARRVSRAKPILALKSGTTGSGARAASSHTAALAGSEAAVDALFRQAGVLRAQTLGELLDVAALLAKQPLPEGRRVGIVTNAGGLGILCADACEAAGLELGSPSPETGEALQALLPAEASTENPIDMLGSATADAYARVVPLLVDDPAFDAVIVLFVPPVTAGGDEVVEALDSALEAGADKPVLAALIGAERESRRLARFDYPETAARALGRAAERADWLRRPAGRATVIEDVDRDAARSVVASADEGWLDPAATRRLLAAYGIPLVEEAVASSADDAARAAEQLGFPVVVKSATAGAHKTETGGVALDLRDADAVRDACRRIGAPVLVQPFLRGGVELLAGVVQDPVFGPLVGFGPGGVYAELIGGAEFRIAPLTDVDAAELVAGGKAGRLVSGFRGAPAANVAALEDLILRLALLGEDLPEVAELDLNPILAGPERCVAVDARVRVAQPPEQRRAKTW
jgi:acetyl coenzyme A synthetase (ADP forming)-like protein